MDLIVFVLNALDEHEMNEKKEMNACGSYFRSTFVIQKFFLSFFLSFDLFMSFGRKFFCSPSEIKAKIMINSSSKCSAYANHYYHAGDLFRRKKIRHENSIKWKFRPQIYYLLITESSRSKWQTVQRGLLLFNFHWRSPNWIRIYGRN